MVSYSVVSRYQGPPDPPDGSGNRKIPDGPLYAMAVVRDVLEINKPSTWTKKCIKDVQQLGLDEDDIKKLILEAISNGRYMGSEWTVNSSRDRAPWAACDAYSLQREEFVAHAKRHMNMDYYIKFFVSKSGKAIVTVSCHLS